MRHHHYAAHGRQLGRDLAHARERVVRLAVVEVAVGREQELGFGLAETVEHAVAAEIGRAGRPDRADRDRRQREHRGLGHVRHEGGDAVARGQALGAHRLRHARHLGVQLGVAEAAAKAGLVPEHQGVGRVAPAQHVLGEIEPRLGKPFGAGHAIAVDEHALALVRGDDAAEIPHRVPELFGAVHAPIIEFRIGVESELPAPDRAARERGDIRLFDQRLARRPHRSF